MHVLCLRQGQRAEGRREQGRSTAVCGSGGRTAVATMGGSERSTAGHRTCRSFPIHAAASKPRKASREGVGPCSSEPAAPRVSLRSASCSPLLATIVGTLPPVRGAQQLPVTAGSLAAFPQSPPSLLRWLNRRSATADRVAAHMHVHAAAASGMPAFASATNCRAQLIQSVRVSQRDVEDGW